MWLGHYQVYALLAAIAIGIASDAFSRSTALSAVASAGFFICLTAMAADFMYHQRQLCERCISSAPALNPEGAVQRWRPALWSVHRINMPLMVTILGWMCWSAIMSHQEPWRYAVDVLGLAVLGYVSFTGYVHRRLIPWCPWCNWDDGGDKEVTPVPEVPAVR